MSEGQGPGSGGVSKALSLAKVDNPELRVELEALIGRRPDLVGPLVELVGPRNSLERANLARSRRADEKARRLVAEVESRLATGEFRRVNAVLCHLAGTEIDPSLAKVDGPKSAGCWPINPFSFRRYYDLAKRRVALLEDEISVDACGASTAFGASHPKT